MFVRMTLTSFPLLLLFALGCGDSAPPANVGQLPPLTKEQMETIKKTDDAVKDEEGKPSIIPKEFQKKAR